MGDGDNQHVSFKGFKWTVGNEDVPALALVVDNYSKQLHICEPGDVGTDWAVAVATHPTVYLHSATNPATEYIKMYHDATNAYIDGVGATTVQILVAGTSEVSISGSAVSPTTTNGAALGTSALMWSDLFLASGGVIYFDNTDVTITHSSSLLTMVGGALTMGASGTPSGDLTLWGTTASYKVWFDVDGDTNGAWYFGADTKGIMTTWYGDTTGYYVKWDPSGGTNGTWYFGANTKGVDVNFYGIVTGCGIFWDAQGDSDQGTLNIGTAGGNQGVDLICYGATNTCSMKWDQSTDDLILNGTATQFIVNGTTDSTTNLTGSIQTDGGLGVTLNLIVGADGTGADVKFHGANAGRFIFWDANGDTDGAWYFGADTEGIMTTWYGDVTGYYVVWNPTTDTNGSWDFGVDDYGVDVRFYGQTAGDSMLWDASAGTLSFTGLSKIDIGLTGTPLVLTAGAPIFELYSTCAGAVGTSAEPFLVSTTLTGIGQVGGRARFYMTADVALGSWSNALKSDMVYGSSGRTTGLGSSFCAELKLSAGTTSGNYAAIEAELVSDTGASTGTATSFFYCNGGGTGVASIIDTDANFLTLGDALTVGSGKFIDNSITTGTGYGGLRVYIPGVGIRWIFLVSG